MRRLPRATVVLAAIGLLAANALARSAPTSTWGATQQHLGPGPVGNQLITPFAFSGGGAALSWFRFDPGTALYRDLLAVSKYGRRLPQGKPDSGPYFNFFDFAISGNARGDLAWAYSATLWQNQPQGQAPTAVEIGTRASGHLPGRVLRIQTDPNLHQQDTPVKVAVSRSGRVAVAWVNGTSGLLFASIGQAGGSFSRPLQLTAPGHSVSQPYDFAVAIGPQGEAFIAWRDLAPTQHEELMVKRGDARGFDAAQTLASSQRAAGPFVIAQNQAGDLLLAWKGWAAIRHRGHNFARPVADGLRQPLAAAVDRDGQGYLLGADPRNRHAVLVTATSGARFAATQRIRLGGSPRASLAARARGAVLASTGFSPGVARPVTVRLIKAGGALSSPVIAVKPTGSVAAVAIAVRSDGAALLAYGIDVGDPYVDLNARWGHVTVGGPGKHGRTR